MRISDWSSDVCSSDLLSRLLSRTARRTELCSAAGRHRPLDGEELLLDMVECQAQRTRGHGRLAEQRQRNARRTQTVPGQLVDRKSVVEGRSGAVRVDLEGRRLIKTKKKTRQRS